MNLRWLPLMLVSLQAYAGPPILADDTGTPGNGNWESNVGFNVERQHVETRYLLPSLDINYGVGERVQINYSVPQVVLDSDATGREKEFGNSELAVKWRFYDHEGLAVSVYPRVIFKSSASVADRGLAERDTISRVPVQIEKKFGNLTLNPEFGHDFRQHGHDEWISGLALKYSHDKELELLSIW